MQIECYDYEYTYLNTVGWGHSALITHVYVYVKKDLANDLMVIQQ